jgi:hypothetical protein
MATFFEIEENTELLVDVKVNFSNQIIAFVLILVSNFAILFFPVLPKALLIYTILAPVFLIYWWYGTRELQTRINLPDKKMIFYKNGILNSKIDRKKYSFGSENIKSVQMIRHAQRGFDTFSIVLLLEDSGPFQITNKDLSFQDCQKFSSELQKFVGTHIPIVAVG